MVHLHGRPDLICSNSTNFNIIWNSQIWVTELFLRPLKPSNGRRMLVFFLEKVGLPLKSYAKKWYHILRKENAVSALSMVPRRIQITYNYIIEYKLIACLSAVNRWMPHVPLSKPQEEQRG